MSTAPFTEQSRVRTSVGFLGTILAIVVASSLAWASVRSEVGANTKALESHERRLDQLETKIESDHDLLLEIRGDVKALREAGGKR